MKKIFNCLAFVLGDHQQWWEPPSGKGTYWPAGFPEDTTVRTVESIIGIHGFSVDLQAGADPETDAIAIYAEGDEWTHFALFSNGVWSSKFGDGNDVVRMRLEDLEGALYGKVVKILGRAKQKSQ